MSGLTENSGRPQRGGERQGLSHQMSAPGNGSVLERLRGLVREVAKFGAVGGLGVLVNLGVFNLIRSTTDLQVVRASVIATVVAIVTNYLGFRYFAYRDRAQSGRTREMALFAAFSGIGLVIENGVLYTATYGFGWDGPLASNVFKFIGIGTATVFRFWSYRTWVFKALPAAAPAAEPIPEPASRAEPGCRPDPLPEPEPANN